AGGPPQQKQGPTAMRIFLLVLALLSFGVQANPDWKAFPFDQSAFDYSGDKLRQAWPRLTLGFGDYPFPDADWVRRMAEQYPEALQRTTSERSEEHTSELQS